MCVFDLLCRRRVFSASSKKNRKNSCSLSAGILSRSPFLCFYGAKVGLIFLYTKLFLVFRVAALPSAPRRYLRTKQRNGTNFRFNRKIVREGLLHQLLNFALLSLKRDCAVIRVLRHSPFLGDNVNYISLRFSRQSPCRI